MIYDEIKKLWEEMMDADVAKMNFSASASVQLPPPDDDMVDKIKNNYMGISPVQQMYAKSYHRHYLGISPTDVDAKGKYPYQEPEVDEQGTFYGYKILKKYYRPDAVRIFLISPRYNVAWNQDGCLTADMRPEENTMHGIHCTKRPDHPELDNYGVYNRKTILVKCALYGTVIETEQGFRAEKAKIVGVYEDEYWESYQDYQERTGADSGSYTREEEHEGWRIRYTAGWKTNPYYNPSADS